MTFNREEDEDTLVEEGLQIERGTVFHKDTWHSEIYPRNIVTMRLPREACFDQGDGQVEKDVVTLSREEDEDTLVRKDLKLNAARCFSGTHATVRVTEEAVVTSGSRVKRVLIWAMSKWTKYIVTFNEEEDEDILVEEGPQIERARCFTGTHATVRFTKEAVVTSGSRVKRVLTRAMSKWRTSLLPLMKRKMKAFSLRKERLPREACFDLGDV